MQRMSQESSMKYDIKLSEIHCQCEVCGDRAVHKHHKLSQTRVYQKLYHRLLDEDFNIMYLCNQCHSNPPKFTEHAFRKAGADAGFIMPKGSKSLQYKVF
jgi:hypothetical protein